MRALRELSGVGPAVERRLRAVGIDTPAALINLRPRDYRDWRRPSSLAAAVAQAFAAVSDPEVTDASPAPEVIVIGDVLSVHRFHGKISVVRAELQDESGVCDVVWFARGRDRVQLDPGMRLFVHGRIKIQRRGKALRPEIAVLAHRVLKPDEPYVGRIWPIYPATRELPSRVTAKVIALNLDALLECVREEYLPADLVARRGFPGPRAAFREVHHPISPDSLGHARERLAFDTFFELAFGAVARRVARARSGGAIAMHAGADLLAQLEDQVGFAFTGAQRRVIHELWHDMSLDSPMHRLLQGDVGSGKTVVAAAAIVLAAQAGAQSALMAPTELLARQHARKLGPLLAPFGIGVEFISGTQGARARREAEERLRDGVIAVAVGTHALLTERVTFAKLGLAVIDEQHRFGVAQRATLRSKSLGVHTLAMTATPIPRTLAQTRYADLDVSVIDELPPGRTPIRTIVRDDSAKPRMYDFVRAEVGKGRQAYIVAPVIDESVATLSSAIAEAEELRTRVFPDLRVGLVHGKLPPKERAAEMERFARGEIDVLIATTVIEVGVDVPNASIMVILDAHRFGLAQLHQLRGRVGRGSAAAMCVLVAPKTTRRLEVLVETSDGFAIADADLELRGEGEFAGTAQAGVEGLIGHAADDIALYLDARQEAEAILQLDPELEESRHAQLRHFSEGAFTHHALLISS